MEIHIKEGEKLVIFAAAPDGTEKTFPISYQEMMRRGESITDGLAESEITHLRNGKKIFAIKLHRSRTHSSLKESKEAVEAWAERNQCCRSWPFCIHMKCITGLDKNKFDHRVQGLSVIWCFLGEVTEKQARTLMLSTGYNPEKYGFYSFRHIDGRTLWNSNKKAK